MDILNQLISSMTKEEIRFFKLYTGRTGSEEERKDIQLFDYIRDHEENYNEGKIFQKLYGKSDKNSFYRLRHRLLDEVNKSLLLQHFEEDDTMSIHHLLSRVRFFFLKRNFSPALFFLKKAESSALRIENYELLDIIYGEYIKLSHELMNIDPEEYIAKRKENYSHLTSHRQINDVMAAVAYRVKISQNFSEEQNPILELLEKTVNDFLLDKKISNSPKLKLSIYGAVSQVLLQKRDYVTLEKYLLETYKNFSRQKIFGKENHKVKLQMLTYIVNAFFKNKKVRKSLEYAEKLRLAMEEYGRAFYEQFLFFYYNSLVINYSVIDKDKAISLLEEFKENEKLKKSPFYELFVFLNLAILWFDKKEYHKSVKNLNLLYFHPNYKNADISLRFKIEVAELIIRYELGDYDFLENKISRLEKDFEDQLKSSHRERELISILKKLPYAENISRDKVLQEQIKRFLLSNKNTSVDDSEIIKYNEWLNEQLTNDN